MFPGISSIFKMWDMRLNLCLRSPLSYLRISVELTSAHEALFLKCHGPFQPVVWGGMLLNEEESNCHVRNVEH